MLLLNAVIAIACNIEMCTEEYPDFHGNNFCVMCPNLADPSGRAV